MADRNRDGVSAFAGYLGNSFTGKPDYLGPIDDTFSWAMPATLDKSFTEYMSRYEANKNSGGFFINLIRKAAFPNIDNWD
jgi:hypothetical protein